MLEGVENEGGFVSMEVYILVCDFVEALAFRIAYYLQIYMIRFDRAAECYTIKSIKKAPPSLYDPIHVPRGIFLSSLAVLPSKNLRHT